MQSGKGTYDHYNHCDPWIIAIIWKPLFTKCSGRSDRKKNQRRGVCDSPLLVVCGGPLIFPRMCGK